MLQLKNIVKNYVMGDNSVEALKGIDLKFRKSEFVSILGPSGCGKTTLLNLVGGLDHYTKGDLIINGKSTKDFKDRDWDTYRNHSVGFVFASGLLGVMITYLLCIPINIIMHYVTGISNLSAVLPIPVAAILVAISVALTLISGIIPSRSAAKKDPVVALRTE